MTIKEITSLRKSGHLAEALKAAEIEFSQNPNKYTAGALFWCLNDIYKKQEKNDAAETIERMKSLYNSYCEGDGIMQHSLANAEATLKLHYQEIKESLNEAKNGNNVFASYERIRSIYDCGELDASLFSDFGWLIYHALKNTPVNNAILRKKMLRNYLKLELPKPSLLHSLILSEAVKVEQNTPKQFLIREFMKIWGFENFREDDWKQFITSDGNTLPSLVEKLIGVYSKEIKTDNVNACDEFSALVDKALEKYPQSQNMPYFKATVLLSQGRQKEAISYYQSLLIRFPSKFYLWYQTAALMEDLNIKIGLLSKALTLGEDEQFLGSVRLSMAKSLIQKGELQHAKYELVKYKDLYNSKDWNLKEDFYILYNQLENIIVAKENHSIYLEYLPIADEFVYRQLPEQTAVKISDKEVEDKNHPGRKIPVWIIKTQNSILRLKKPTKLGLDKRLKAGTMFSVKIYDNKIVWIKVLEQAPLTNWLKDVTGVIVLRTDRNGKRYAIIDRCYVNDKLLTSVSDGQTVTIRSIKKDDGRWSAISLIKQV